MTTGQESDQTTTRSHRLLWTVVILMLGAAASLWASSALRWLSQRYRSPFAGVTTATVFGAQLRPELVPMALAALAAIAAMLATKARLRRLIGLLVAIGGGLLAWRAIDQWGFGLLAYPGVPPGSAPVGQPDTNPAGPLLMVLGALLLIMAGLLVTVRAADMPAMGAKYAAPGAAKRTQDPDKRIWDSLDRGEDPTAGP